MAGKMHFADSGLSFSLGALLYNPEEREVPPSPSHFIFVIKLF